MELIIGGSFQGKLEYAKRKLEERNIPADELEIVFGEELRTEQLKNITCTIFDHLHLFIKNCVENGEAEEIKGAVEHFLEHNPDCIMICDEIGYGVVPIMQSDRIYRELTGRILCMLTGRAESVERIVGGLPMRIK